MNNQNQPRTDSKSSLRYLRHLVAFIIVVAVYWATRLPSVSQAERSQIAGDFAFASLPVPEVSGPEARSVRPVHPKLQHIASWISSVGAACSLADLDSDAMPNDLCYVDTRTDQVIVAPVPGTGQRYAPFVLDPGSSRFQRETMCPTGCVPGDLNEDGLIDLMVYYWGRTPIAFLQRPKSEALSSERFAPVEIDSSGERWYTNAMTRADIDGDGHTDLIVGNYFQDGARVLDVNATDNQQMHHSMSRSFNGGHNRLFLWESGGTGENPTVRYREVKGVWDEEIARGWTLAIAAADLDGDLLPELHFSNDFGHDRLLHNRSTPGNPKFAVLEGEKKFTTPNSKVLGRDSFKGMGADFGDLNGDGQLDLYVSNIAKEFALEESHFMWINTGESKRMQDGVAPFVECSEKLGLSRSGWGWESRLADFNNDGVLEAIQATGFVKGETNRWPQLHEAAMGNDLLLRHAINWHRVEPGDDLSGDEHNPFFVRASDGRFYDMAVELGIDTPQVTRGIATADVDGDGDIDFLAGNQWVPSVFYRNDSSSKKPFVGLRIMFDIAGEQHSTSSNDVSIIAGRTVLATKARPAIGAQATLKHSKQMAQVDGGNGHSGIRSPELHFGLGDFDSKQDVEVTLKWRDQNGAVQEQDVVLGQPGWYTVVLPSQGVKPPSNEIALGEI